MPAKATKLCERCFRPVAVDELVSGRFGRACAEKIGLSGINPDGEQTGPDLFDAMEIHSPAPGNTRPDLR